MFWHWDPQGRVGPEARMDIGLLAPRPPNVPLTNGLIAIFDVNRGQLGGLGSDIMITMVLWNSVYRIHASLCLQENIGTGSGCLPACHRDLLDRLGFVSWLLEPTPPHP